MSRPNLDWNILKRFVNTELASHRVGVAKAIAFMVIAAIATTGAAWIIQFVIDDLFVDKRADLIWPIALGIIGVYALKGIATYGYSIQLARISAKLAAKMRMKAIRRLFAQNIPFHDENETADLVNRISNVTGSAGSLVSLLTTSAMRDALTVIFLIIFMLFQNWQLTILTFLIAPPVVGGVTLISRRIRDSVKGQFTVTSQFMQQMIERLSGIRVVKASRAEAESEALIQKSVHGLQEQAVKIARVSALNSPLMEMLGGIAVAAMIAYASYSVIGGHNTAGEIMAFIMAFISAYEPVKRLSSLRVSLVNFLVPLEFYYELQDRENPQTFGDAKLPEGALSIEFANVDFRYSEKDQLANRGVSFVAEAGQTTALVGRSGSGKSTVFSLLQRFYDPSSGSVQIGGVNASDLSEETLREAIAYIPQEAVIFTGTLAENISLGQKGRTREEISDAASKAYLDDVIAGLSDGLDTMIGEGQMSLSGGQKQRLSIARAILKDAPILLLDEATSALDSEAEAVVQKALQSATKGKTVLAIAHRLSTIREADKIIVMDKGHVVEEGDHKTLLKQNGIYAMLSKLQNQE